MPGGLDAGHKGFCLSAKDTCINKVSLLGL